MMFLKRHLKAALTCLGAVGVLIVVVLVATSTAAKNGVVEEGADLLPAKKLLKSRPKKISDTAAPLPPQTLDLLDLIQASQDSIAGDWGFQDRALVTSSIKWGRLQVPCVPPEEYDLQLTVTRKKGANSFNIGLGVDGRQTMVVLDGQDGVTSWLYTHMEDSPVKETAVSGRTLRYNTRTQVTCAVRKSGIAVKVDGKSVIDWKGNLLDLYLEPAWQVPSSKALILGSYESAFLIDEVRLTPVTGSCTLLR
jgi:hypothetical protein